LIKFINHNNKLTWFFQEYINQKTNLICVIIILIFIGTSIGNMSPFLFGKMIDIIGKSNSNELLNLIFLYFAITILATLLGLFEGYLGQTMSFKLVKKVQIDMFSKIMTLNERSLKRYDTGELISRLSGDADSVINFFLNIITSVIQIVINLCISIYFVIYISKQLSVVSLFYIPLSLLVNIRVRKYYKQLAEKRKNLGDKYFNFLSESFSNCSSIKIFNLQTRIINKFRDFTFKEYNLLKKSILLSSIVNIITTLITVFSSLFIIYYSAILINKGALTVGLMVSFNTYINKLFGSISQILSLNIQKQEVEVSIERLTKIMLDNSEDEISINKNKDKFSISKNENFNNIYIENVSFSYEEEAVLSDLSIEINRSGFYSLVGKNGCGKSTIAKLIIRLYEADKGEIKFCRTNINDCSTNLIRENITYIQKEDFFFNDTIYNNLKLANENISECDIEEVCKKVDIDDDISSLSDGYYTLMGESGSNFSSGQKQKLSIARSLLRKSRIYVYDESTANLDGKSEKLIIELLLELSKNSIVIFISHKVSSIINSDKIFVVDSGRVTATGKHNHLLENCELYKVLFYSK